MHAWVAAHTPLPPLPNCDDCCGGASSMGLSTFGANSANAGGDGGLTTSATVAITIKTTSAIDP
jgi:hypothetical protein